MWYTRSRGTIKPAELILPDIISLNQSAFMPARLIIDNVLLAYELAHYMQNKWRGSEGLAALKLDMSKAYDRVEWEFLARMMLELGFNQMGECGDGICDNGLLSGQS